MSLKTKSLERRRGGSGLNMWFVDWVRNATQHLCVNKHGFVGWRYAYPTYRSTDLTHYQVSKRGYQE